MNLRLDKAIAEKYHSESQIIRIITEKWVEKESFCPSCGSGLKKHEANKPVLDYYCFGCAEDFELKISIF